VLAWSPGNEGGTWAVVASSRTIKRLQEPNLVTVAGDITEPATAGRIVDNALDRFGRIDTLVNKCL
jgi:NAD(P)-dependent dehydrogenase (short-subunit alcohol dehydrogenase family)